MAQPVRHVPALDGLRGIAILWVMLFHMAVVPVVGSAARVWKAVAAHGAHEARTGKEDPEWPAWYADYLVREQAGVGVGLRREHQSRFLCRGAAGPLACGGGLGAATHVTGAFAFAAVGKVLERLLEAGKSAVGE